MKKVIPVFAYLRVSGQGQIAGHGFERQLTTIRKFCKKKYQIVGVYKETVRGATEEDGRPIFTDMVADMLSNSVRVIMIESLDRLAREYRIQENILIYLASKGLSLIAANTGENVTQAISSDPMKKCLIQMQGIFSELEKNLLVKKLRRAREAVRKEKGRCEGAKLYGTLPGESEVVKMVRRLRRKPKSSPSVKRMSCQKIADQLNSEGIKPRRAKRWSAALVYGICAKKRNLT